MADKKHNLSNDPPWYIQQFPIRLIKQIKTRVLLTDSTIPAVLVKELTAVVDRLEENPDARAPELASFGETKEPWLVKHFPEALRLRLVEIAENEHTDLWKLVAREMTAAAEEWDLNL